MAFRENMRRGRVSAHPPQGQTGGLYPQARAFVFEIQNFVKESKSVEAEKPLRVERKKKSAPEERRS
jgi:hypothetical protein